MHTFLQYIVQYSYPGIFISIALGILGLPVPDEALMVFLGFMIFQGKLNYFFAIIVAFIGTSCGITIGFLIGRVSDKFVIKKYSGRIRIHPEHFQNVEEFYNKYGNWALLIGYFIPGVRHLTAILAGVSMSYGRFAAWAYAGALLWTIVFINLGYFLGDSWHLFARYSNRFIIPLAAIALLVIIIVMYLKPDKNR